MCAHPFTGDVQLVHGLDDEWRRRVGRWRIFFVLDRRRCRVVVNDIVRRTSTTY